MQAPVQPIPAIIPSSGERMVWLVASERKPSVRYRVDLTANGGASQCSCTDWGTRRGPAIKAGAPHGTRETCCKHVAAVRRKFLNDLLADMAKSETQ